MRHPINTPNLLNHKHFKNLVMVFVSSTSYLHNNHNKYTLKTKLMGTELPYFRGLVGLGSLKGGRTFET